MKKSISHQLVSVTLCVIILSTVLVLIILILITFCVIYRRVNPKHIYHVNEKGENVYFIEHQSDFWQKYSRKIIELCLFCKTERASRDARVWVQFMRKLWKSYNKFWNKLKKLSVKKKPWEETLTHFVCYKPVDQSRSAFFFALVYFYFHAFSFRVMNV